VASLLIDLSAWARSSHPSARARWKDLVEGDELACHPVFALELLHNSINPEDHQRLRNDLEAAFDWVWPDDDTARLALRLQQRILARAPARAAQCPGGTLGAWTRGSIHSRRAFAATGFRSRGTTRRRAPGNALARDVDGRATRSGFELCEFASELAGSARQ
jgi:hypothetical protein